MMGSMRTFVTDGRTDGLTDGAGFIRTRERVLITDKSEFIARIPPESGVQKRGPYRNNRAR